MTGVGALLASNLRRFFSRRAMRGAFAFGIALSTLVLVLITARSTPPTVGTSSHGIICSGPPPGTCVPQTEHVIHDRRIKIHDNLSGTIKGTGVAMVFVAFVIGASFVGAEFSAGSLGSQLLFEPRRARVVLVKAVAVAVGLAVLAIGILLYIALLQWAGSALRGVVHGLNASWFAARAGDMGRVAAAVALAGVAAFAITVVARRTVGAVAALLMVGFGSAIIGGLAKWRWLAKFNPTSAFLALAVDPRRTAQDSHVLTVQAAALTSCVWVVALTAAAAVIFSRREVR